MWNGMSWKNSVLIFIIFLSCQKNQDKALFEDSHNYLIEAVELKPLINKSNIKVLDFRKREDYENSHIIGALHITRNDIEDKSYPYGGMMAKKEQMESLLSNLGINNDDTIIIYDDNGMCEASRLWWILQNYNYDNVKILHGGIVGWENINGETTMEGTEVSKSNFRFNETPYMKYYVSKNKVHEALQRNTVLIDTRNNDEFTGKYHKKGAKKPGRIPNSINIDWAKNINYDDNKRLKSIEELKTIYDKLNINKTYSIILYCHSGVRSANTTFVLTQLLGYKNVMNYDGSWTEWSHFNDLPSVSDHIQ
jgi:thiosulfate/3-mercaptopyruvate sulfurtransferase